ncbi:MAG TPA: BON domain-containing protein [Bacteroidia bacterium]
MKTNEELQKDVQDAIKWEPLLNAAEIGVIAKDGVVTLTGTVDSYTKKLEAEDAAKNVGGVEAVIEKIIVKFGKSLNKSDDEIAIEVLAALKGSWQIPSGKIKVKVENGWITLSGVLNWNYQKDVAKNLVSHLAVVTGVTNNVTIKSLSNDEIERKDIELALERNWSINSEDITVKVSDHKVTLSGIVSSWYQKDEAERIAWKAPGVWTVDNKLIVEYDYSFAD